MYLFSEQMLKVSVDNNLELEHYYASGESSHIGKRLLKGKLIYETYIYSVDAVRDAVNKVNRKNKRIYK